MSDLPPESPTLFIDRNSGGRTFRDILTNAGLRVVLHDEEFPQTAADEDWLQAVGQKGWVIITEDKATTTSPLFLQRLSRSSASVFILMGLNGESAEGKARCIIGLFPKIEELISQTKPPAMWRIGKQRSVRIIDFRTILQKMARNRRL